jgi:hypothetical protein
MTSPRFAGTAVTSHHLELADDKQPSGRVRYRVCKVCSALHTDESTPTGKSIAYVVNVRLKSVAFTCVIALETTIKATT